MPSAITMCFLLLHALCSAPVLNIPKVQVVFGHGNLWPIEDAGLIHVIPNV
jgi:hypothetical protein